MKETIQNLRNTENYQWLISTNREDLTRKLVGILKENELVIVASTLEEYNVKPEEFDGYTPDVVAYDSRKQLVVLGSASLCDILENPSNAEKLRALSSRAMDEGASKGEAVPYHLIVPKECAEKVREYLKALGLDYNVLLWTT